MKKHYAAVLLLSLFTTVALSASGKNETLTLDKCGACHKAEALCKHLGIKNHAAWTKTVDVMISKGAKITPDEKKSIVSYLAGLKKGARPICH